MKKKIGDQDDKEFLDTLGLRINGLENCLEKTKMSIILNLYYATKKKMHNKPFLERVLSSLFAAGSGQFSV